MCKILTFTNFEKLKTKKASEAIGKIIQKSEQDGYGYAIQGQTNVYGEKTISENFISRMFEQHIVKLPIFEKTYEKFGKYEKPKGPAMFHGRTCTNDYGLLNCHPLEKQDYYLIHNGVVRDNGPNYKKVTTNDTEDLLHRFIQGIDQVEKNLTGYYAFAAIDPNGRLHIVRDAIAELYIAWSPDAESFIFGTTELLIKSSCQALNIKHGPIEKMLEDTYLIFEKNKLVHQQSIDSLGYEYEQAKYAEKSLGYSLYSEPYYSYKDDYKNDEYEILEEMMQELHNIDDTYRIISWDGLELTANEFKKLDEINQAECTIYRADGSLVEMPDSYWNKAA